IYFGDRCSPVSTSALLVSTLTRTDIYENIKGMLRSAWVPFGATCLIYLGLGLLSDHSSALIDVESIFSGALRLHWLALLPAAAILLLSAFRVKVRKTMIVSIILAFILCLTLQDMTLPQLLYLLVYGYQSPDPQVAAMLNGGGILSMVRVSAIVCLSSSYAGIFEGTGLLTEIKGTIAALSRRITPFGAIACTATVTSMVACNQTLSIMLTDQLCRDLEPDERTFAIHLENSAVVIAPLIPWCIAGAVPIATVGAPTGCLLWACFLYLLPAWHWFASRPRT
ncbi:MAG: sodium:proton antiporter, partial [Ruminococcaceae bacterium]|nr:sodium:proton antiporter [Oscillospiraceae bacterium]